jgi:hypothetical protein
MMIDILGLLSAVALGLFAGSLLLEGLVLVPFWRGLLPDTFFQMHHDFGGRLFAYFAPLTIMAASLPVSFALLMKGGDCFGNVAALGSIGVLLFFPLFFKKANGEFANRQISNEQLPSRLKAWSLFHSVRTAIAILAFSASVLAVHSL